MVLLALPARHIASLAAQSQPHADTKQRRSPALSCPGTFRQTPRCITSGRASVVAHNKLGDELLDYVTAGPKLRKWYGQGQQLPRDGGGPPDEQEPSRQEEEGPVVRDAVLVTDADSATGDQVILQLINARARVKAWVRDTAAAKTSFGPYVEPLSFDVNSEGAWRKALRDVSALVCVGQVGAALPAGAKKAGVEHVVLLSSAGLGQQGGFDLGSMFASAEDKSLKDPKREEAFRAAQLPLTIVRAARIGDTPGGRAAIALRQSGRAAGSGSSAVSREDLAKVMVQALQRRPESTLEFQVVSDSTASAPVDWEQAFMTLEEGGASA